LEVANSTRNRFWTQKTRVGVCCSSAIEHFSRVYVASSKREEGWENSRQLCKPETTINGSPQPLDIFWSGLREKPFENSPSLRVFRSGYVKIKKALYCFYKIILKTTRKSKTSQRCLHTLIQTQLSTNESARSSSVISWRRIFVYNVCLISINDPVSNGASKTLVWNIERIPSLCKVVC